MTKKGWEYRVIKRVYPEELVEFAIYEVYLEDGIASSPSSLPAYPLGATLEQLKRDMKAFQKALKAPVLDWDDFKNKGE